MPKRTALVRLGKGVKPHRILILRIINAGRTVIAQKLGPDDKPQGHSYHIPRERLIEGKS